MTSPALIIVSWILAIAGLTAAVAAVARKVTRSGAGAVVIGTLLAPLLWVLWGLSFLYFGTPTSDHDETFVYVGVSIFVALVTLAAELCSERRHGEVAEVAR